MKEELDLSDSSIRLNACRVLGFIKKALGDGNWEIRMEAYRVLGYTKKALVMEIGRLEWKLIEC